MDGPTGLDASGAARLTPPSAAADLAEKFQAWEEYLSVEKRFSRHTLRAYLSDLRYFFDFMTQHQGHPPSIQDLSAASIPDFRSWMSKQTVAGKQPRQLMFPGD